MARCGSPATQSCLLPNLHCSPRAWALNVWSSGLIVLSCAVAAQPRAGVQGWALFLLLLLLLASCSTWSRRGSTTGTLVPRPSMLTKPTPAAASCACLLPRCDLRALCCFWPSSSSRGQGWRGLPMASTATACHCLPDPESRSNHTITARYFGFTGPFCHPHWYIISSFLHLQPVGNGKRPNANQNRQRPARLALR